MYSKLKNKNYCICTFSELLWSKLYCSLCISIDTKLDLILSQVCLPYLFNSLTCRVLLLLLVILSALISLLKNPAISLQLANMNLKTSLLNLTPFSHYSKYTSIAYNAYKFFSSFYLKNIIKIVIMIYFNDFIQAYLVLCNFVKYSIN